MEYFFFFKVLYTSCMLVQRSLIQGQYWSQVSRKKHKQTSINAGKQKIVLILHILFTCVCRTTTLCVHWVRKKTALNQYYCVTVLQKPISCNFPLSVP